MSQPNRLPADAAHEFGGIAIDRGKPLQFTLNGRRIHGFHGDTVLSALLASGIDAYGRFGDTMLALSDRLAPLATSRGNGDPLPIDRLPALDGAALTTIGHRHFSLGPGKSLAHRIDGVPEMPWLRSLATEARCTDLLIVGGGVAGLAAAEAAAAAGHKIILVERRPWLGGDARYFGPVGDEASPAAVTDALIARLASQDTVTLLDNAELFALHGSSARVHRIAEGRGAVIAITAKRIILATGSVQRLPIFSGNRLPGVTSSISAYHFAKRYGVTPGRSAIVATQSNYGYRLALRLADAGIAIRRIVDPRVNPQSRFIDFAKASGLTLAGGQIPAGATPARRGGLRLSFATIGTQTAPAPFDADSLIVSGPFQADLALWMLAGGGTVWSDGRLRSRGQVEHLALAGSAAGYRSMAACVASGRAAVSGLYGGPPIAVADSEIGAPYETPGAATMVAPPILGNPAFLDAGSSLIMRADPAAKPMLTRHAQPPSVGDVAASVELGLTSPADAGAVAEERGASGGDLASSDWQPVAAAQTEPTAWLAGRFDGETTEIRLIVDGKRRFERGALVYANTTPADPMLAIGIIARETDAGQPGGYALISSKVLARTDRFIVEIMAGPSPARIAVD